MQCRCRHTTQPFSRLHAVSHAMLLCTIGVDTALIYCYVTGVKLSSSILSCPSALPRLTREGHPPERETDGLMRDSRSRWAGPLSTHKIGTFLACYGKQLSKDRCSAENRALGVTVRARGRLEGALGVTVRAQSEYGMKKRVLRTKLPRTCEQERAQNEGAGGARQVGEAATLAIKPWR